MAEAGTYGEARSGNWLWALLVGATLLMMEFILFVSLVPTAWSEQVRDTQLAWPHEGLGARTVNAVVERAEHWYGTLFVSTALVDTSYRIAANGRGRATRLRAIAARHAAALVLGGGPFGGALGGPLSGAATGGHAHGLVAVSPAPSCRRVGRRLGSPAHMAVGAWVCKPACSWCLSAATANSIAWPSRLRTSINGSRETMTLCSSDELRAA